MADPTRLFPVSDPIPLPAPVWLFKALSYLTLTLHFAFLALLLGGLLLALVWNLVGHAKGSKVALDASKLVVGKLTMVTTYVINLGVPPLLFAQVLYGRALYTSSVLIGAWWISVVFLVMGAYAVLYRVSALAKKDRPWWAWGIVSFVVLAGVGRIFAANMTLMIEPDSWRAIYEANPHGTHFPASALANARWIVAMLSVFAMGFLGTTLWTTAKSVSPDVRQFVRTWAGLGALALTPLIALAGLAMVNSIPPALQERLFDDGNPWARLSLAWIGAVSLAGVVGGLLLLLRKSASPVLPWISVVPVLGTLACWVFLRDVMRDTALSAKGFDVWKSAVDANWTVVILFVATLVIGLAVMGWIGFVISGTKPEEKAHV